MLLNVNIVSHYLYLSSRDISLNCNGPPHTSIQHCCFNVWFFKSSVLFLEVDIGDIGSASLSFSMLGIPTTYALYEHLLTLNKLNVQVRNSFETRTFYSSYQKFYICNHELPSYQPNSLSTLFHETSPFPGTKRMPAVDSSQRKR